MREPGYMHYPPSTAPPPYMRRCACRHIAFYWLIFFPVLLPLNVLLLISFAAVPSAEAGFTHWVRDVSLATRRQIDQVTTPRYTRWLWHMSEALCMDASGSRASSRASNERNASYEVADSNEEDTPGARASRVTMMLWLVAPLCVPRTKFWISIASDFGSTLVLTAIEPVTFQKYSGLYYVPHARYSSNPVLLALPCVNTRRSTVYRIRS